MKLLPIALTLLNGTAQNRLTGLTTRAKSLAVIASLGGISAAFLLIALTILLAAEVGAVFACLIMSGVFGAGALIMFFRFSRRRRNRMMEEAEQIALASSADTSVGATGILLAQAFAKGFFGSRR